VWWASRGKAAGTELKMFPTQFWLRDRATVGQSLIRLYELGLVRIKAATGYFSVTPIFAGGQPSR
jgi:hypothetical protein